MTRPLIAVTDSVFPSLDPAMAALKQLDPEIRIAKSTSEADILDVARDADGVLVTYAKLPGELLRQEIQTSGPRPRNGAISKNCFVLQVDSRGAPF